MDDLIEEEISRNDSTPSILQQAEKEGWKAGYYNFGKADDGTRQWFNPSIVERDDGIWLLVRGSEPHAQGFPFGQNFIWAFELDETGKTPKRGIRLRWPVEVADQHFEDPRGFYHPGIDQTIIGACTFIWYPDRSWTGAHQCIGSFDDKWECSKMDYPKLGGSPGMLDMITDKKRYEKNWLPFLYDNRLHILYKAKPWQIVGYGQTWSDYQKYEGDGVSWAYGDIRGGTSPVKVGDHYFTFPHSSLMWRGRYRRYYAGAMAFDAKPPFTPRMITPEPLLRGSQNDVWAQKKPLVIFPCGALYRKGTWLITCGVNDLKAAWVEIPHEDILRRMVPIDRSGTSVFPASGLSESEQKTLSGSKELRQVRDTSEGGESPTCCGIENRHEENAPAQKLSGEALKQKQRENAAKARQVRAAKRMAMHGTQGEPAAGGLTKVGFPPHGTRSLPRKRKRMRRKRTSKEKLQALQKFEAEKSLVSSLEQ